MWAIVRLQRTISLRLNDQCVQQVFCGIKTGGFSGGVGGGGGIKTGGTGNSASVGGGNRTSGSSGGGSGGGSGGAAANAPRGRAPDKATAAPRPSSLVPGDSTGVICYARFVALLGPKMENLTACAGLLNKYFKDKVKHEAFASDPAIFASYA